MHKGLLSKQQRYVVVFLAIGLLVIGAGNSRADFTPGDCAGIDPVVYLALEEDGSTIDPDDFDDAAPGDNDGNCDATVENRCPVKNDGRVGFGQDFSSASNLGIDVSPFAAIDWGSDDSFSVEVWIKATSVPAGGTDVLVGRSVQSGGDGMHWFVGIQNETGMATFYLESNASTGGDPDAVQIVAQTNVLDDQWHHLVAVRDGINESIQLYVDGRLEAKAGAVYDPDPDAFSDAGEALTIGYINKAGFFHYRGILDEVAVYDDILPDSAIWAHYINGMQASPLDYCTGSAPIIDANTPTQLEDATVGFDYEKNLFAGGNPVPSTYTLGMDAPVGMSLGGNTIQWRPVDTDVGDNTFEITAGNTMPPDATGDYTISVLELCRESMPILTSHWKFEETLPDTGLDTGTLLDSFLNGHDGTCDDLSAHTVCPEIGSGILGNAQVFDSAASTGVDITGDAAFDYDNTDSFSVEFWMKTPSSGSEINFSDVLIGRTDVATGGDMEWFVAMQEVGTTNVGIPYVYFHDADNSNDDTVELRGETNLNDGQWHHLVLVRDGSKPSITLYVDGEVDSAAGTAFSSSLISASAENLNIAYLNKTTFFHFSGSLDELAIYDYALSNAMARQHYSEGTPARGYCNVKPVIDSQNAIDTDEETPRTIELADLLSVTDDDNTFPDDFSLLVQDGVNYTRTDNTITPDDEFNGDLSVGVTVNDGSDTSDVFNLTVTVNPVNDQPVIDAQAGALSTAEEAGLAIALTDLTVTDPDNTYPADFSLTVADGDNYSVSGTTITPDAEFNGDLTVAVTVDDGSGAANSESASFDLTVSVTAVNDRPVINAQAGALSTAEETGLAIALTDLTVTDPDNTYPTGFSLTVADGDNYSVSGTTITPDAEFNGNLTVAVTVDDGSGAANSESTSFDLTVSVTAVNDAPVITSTAPTSGAQSQLYTYQATATDAEGDSLSWSLSNEPAGMTVEAATGLVSWTPDFGVVTSGTVVLSVADGNGGSDSESFTVTVSVTNRAPDITSTASDTAEEGVQYSYQAEATDADGDTLTWSLTVSPADMTVDAASGLVTWTPGAGLTSPVDVTLEVSDGNGGSDSEMFTITVTPAGDDDDDDDDDDGGGGGGSNDFCFVNTLGI